MDLKKTKPSKNFEDRTGYTELDQFLNKWLIRANPVYAYRNIKGAKRQSIDLQKTPESKNFEDNTTPYKKFIKHSRNRFLQRMHLALDGDPAFDMGLLPPVLKNGEGYTRDYNDIEWSPQEAKMLDRGANPQDLFILRAYKKFPGLVGK